jgi:hypothetical protein
LTSERIPFRGSGALPAILLRRREKLACSPENHVSNFDQIRRFRFTPR